MFLYIRFLCCWFLPSYLLTYARVTYGGSVWLYLHYFHQAIPLAPSLSQSRMSKLAVSSVRASIKELLNGSQEKKRKFIETIELQIGLKNYDPQRDKRFSGTVKLGLICRSFMLVSHRV